MSGERGDEPEKGQCTVIPSAALLQHVAILGKTGSGKTYTAKGLVEGIIDDKRRLGVSAWVGHDP